VDVGNKKENAYLTVYLALTLSVLLPLFGTMISAARKNGAALEATCAADIGMQSMMAEYHRELWERYDLLALDVSYGTECCGKRYAEARLYEYIGKNLKPGGRDFFSLFVTGAELTDVAILTDGGGAVLRSAAIDACSSEIGLELLARVTEWMETIRINGLEQAQPLEDKTRIDVQIQEYEGVEEAKEVENPTRHLDEVRAGGILRLVLDADCEISDKALGMEQRVSARLKKGEISKGNMVLPWNNSLEENFLFREYLMQHMRNYLASEEEAPLEATALDYQVEYLLIGEEKDVDNLKGVANRLCLLREAANALYLFSDSEKKGQVDMLATTICTACLVPELAPALSTSILLGWAYAESVCDVRDLLAGEKIPLLKTDETWSLSLSNALEGLFSGEEEEAAEGEISDGGLGYAEYLRLLLMMSGLNDITARAMDLVEADIRLTPGNRFFRLDGCYRSVKARINIASEEGYAFEMLRSKDYQE
jgi:hypothetical protein